MPKPKRGPKPTHYRPPACPPDDDLGPFVRDMIRRAAYAHELHGVRGVQAMADRLQVTRRAVQKWWLSGTTPRGPLRTKLWALIAVHHPAHFDLMRENATGPLATELDLALTCIQTGDYSEVTTREERRRMGAPEPPRHIPGVIPEAA